MAGMSLLILVQAIERSVLQSNAPTVATLTTRFDAAMQQIRGAADTDTRWLAPLPRVVRSFDTAALHGNVTSAANIAKVPNADVATRLRAALETLLSVEGNFEVVATDYTEATSGPTTFWTGGDADITRTRDAFPELGGRFDAAENPIGPDSRATRPGTVAEGLTDFANAAGRATAAAGLPLVGLALGGLALWFVAENHGAIGRRMRIT